MQFMEGIAMSTAYERYKAGEKVSKAKVLKEFWDTNPTYEQRNIWNKMLRQTLFLGVLCGVCMGIGIGVALSGVI